MFDHEEPSDEPPTPSVQQGLDQLESIVLSDTSLHFSPGGSDSISPSQDNKRKHPCHFCSKSFSSASNRARHERTQHAAQMADSTQIAKFNCLFCNKLCFSQHALQLHAQSCRGQLLSSAPPPLPRLAELATTIASTPSGNGGGVALVPPSGLFSSESSRNESPRSTDNSDSSLDTSTTTYSSDEVDAASTTSTQSLSPSPSMTQSIITDESLNSIIGGFMSWLEEGPISVIEQMVKKRRLSSDDQRVPVRNNLRHLLLTVSALQSVEVTSLSLSSLV
jgi:hypothetical protein